MDDRKAAIAYEKPVIADYGNLIELTASNQLADCEDAGGKPPFPNLDYCHSRLVNRLNSELIDGIHRLLRCRSR